MNPQQNPAQNQDLEPVVQVPDIPAAPTPAVPDPTGATPTPVAPTTMPTTPVDPAQPASTTTPSPGPAVASNDVDVIEKEWVDKAQEIVQKNQDDPYEEENAVEELQTDYLKKRYNHTVDKSQEG